MELSDAVNIINKILQQQTRLLITKSDGTSDRNTDRLFKCLQHVSGLENQSEVGDSVAQKSEWIESLVSFATWVFEGTVSVGLINYARMHNLVTTLPRPVLLNFSLQTQLVE